MVVLPMTNKHNTTGLAVTRGDSRPFVGVQTREPPET